MKTMAAWAVTGNFTPPEKMNRALPLCISMSASPRSVLPPRSVQYRTEHIRAGNAALMIKLTTGLGRGFEPG